MNVALTVGDFLTRAAQVHPDRVAVVDEPDTPGSLGRLTYAAAPPAGPGHGAGARRDGRRPRRAGGDRQPQRRPLPGRLLGVSGFGRMVVPINFRLNGRRGALHRRALRRIGAAGRPRARRGAGAACTAKHRIVLDGASRRRAVRRGARRRRARALGAGRGRHRHDQLHVGHDRAAQGRADHPPQLLAQRRRRSAGTSASPTATSYLHTLPMFHCNGWGMPYAVTGMGGRQVVLRKVDGEEILAAHRGRRRDAAVRRAGGRGRRSSTPPRRAASGARRSRGGTGCAWSWPARRRRRRPSSGSRTELGWEFIQIYGLTETSPLLTMNRAPPEWDGLDAAERARLLSRAGRARDRRADRGRRRGRGARPVEPRVRGLLGAARGDRQGDRRRLVPHRRRRPPRRRATSSSPTARRT